MLDANNQPIQKGDPVRLISEPHSHHFGPYLLTVGKEYVITDFMGSNVVTTTDEPGETASYWRGRVVRVRPVTATEATNE